MCGLAGFIDGARRLDQPAGLAIARRMGSTLRHRGPDDAGVWWDHDAGLALAHRRLAIIDLSAAGHQPMLSPSGRFVVAYNGEIYNFLAIRRDLADVGARFRGCSDTEVLLAAIDRWGLEATIDRINGMFAIALWDRQQQVLHLVRDRLGKKPLYFGWAGRSFLFASELKAFHAHPDFVPELNRAATALLLRYGCVPAPHSIWRGVFKLMPAGHLALPRDSDVTHEFPWERVRIYWSMHKIAQRGVQRPFQIDEAEAVDRLDDLLSQATEQRMIADVPLGALLSGGIDSSTVIALMRKHSARPVKTFSVGFHESGYDEATSAKRIALHLGTDHTEVYITPEETRAVIPRLPEIYDEPFADRSQIPTFLIAQLAREEVRVALSGDGGDEVFGGYNRHSYGPWLWRRMKPWPRAVRRRAAGVLKAISPGTWDAAAAQLYRFLPPSGRQPMPGFRVHKLADLLAVEGPEAIYHRLTSYWEQPEALVIDGCEPQAVVADPAHVPLGADFTCEMMYLDAVTYLPNDILVKVDRASMAVSLEVRAPLLDYRVIEFAWRLPTTMKVRERLGKWVLRQVLERYVPRNLIDRPKQGFAPPIELWLRGPLRDWAEALLEPRRLAAEGILRPEPIRAAWTEHLSGARDRIEALWPVLMFQAWHERWHLIGTDRRARLRCAPAPLHLP